MNGYTHVSHRSSNAHLARQHARGEETVGVINVTRHPKPQTLITDRTTQDFHHKYDAFFFFHGSMTSPAVRPLPKYRHRIN